MADVCLSAEWEGVDELPGLCSEAKLLWVCSERKVPVRGQTSKMASLMSHRKLPIVRIATAVGKTRSIDQSSD